MALCHNCDDTRIEYIGNGTQTDYTFPFEYNERGDVGVANWNEDFLVWEPVPDGKWSFQNDTTLRFVDAPESGQKFIIYRCTDLEPLPAEFYPGTPIKAKDLNDNFFVLKAAIEEAKCAIQRNDEKSEEKYWNKIPYDPITNLPTPDVGETIYSTDEWICTDDAVATTAAICDHVEAEIDLLKVTEKQQREGEWIKDVAPVDDDEHFATTAATTERYDPYFQEQTPAVAPYELPGKHWFDNDRIQSAVWDQENRTWVANAMGGPPGPVGPAGTYMTIVSDNAPTRRVDYSPLLNGDVWFNSTNAELYIWYDDGRPAGSPRSRQWVQAIGGAGAKGEPGEPGTDGEMTLANLLSENPIIIDKDNTNKTANFHIDLLTLPDA